MSDSRTLAPNKSIETKRHDLPPLPPGATVSFSAFPAYLPGSSLMIVVYNGPKGDVGYRFKVKDFIAMEKSR